ncbi:unnamed protein product [Adineta steineri]|uniref:Uncharacterized protein n=1 Tax=Adineta steineri TaxID=433720 RepID=A0A813TJU7_9BILA|nr:unnamed protein product [Adineta steineri]
MNRLFNTKVDHDKDDNNGYKHALRDGHRKKSTAFAVISPRLSILEKYTNARIVRIRLVFIHIGEIDTLNEKYQADIYYEARWMENNMNISTLNLTAQQQQTLLSNEKNVTVKMNEFNSIVHWSPQLFIENAIGQIGEQEKWFTIKKMDRLSATHLINAEICEHRRIKGVFWEKLELNHFPADVQDLTISITSHHHIENCVLKQDKQLRSSINREAFFDQQEWSLYEHVAAEIRETKEEYSFDGDQNEGLEQKRHPVLAIACRAARRPGYYYWNAFFLILLITMLAFCIFSISPDLPQNRLQITCTLLLTSVTFRWVVNRSLPPVSYLTTLDIYAIISIVILVVLCVWHSIIASVIFLNPLSVKILQPSNYYVIIDRYVFIGLFVMYIAIHIALILWLISGPYKRRRAMEHLDREYAAMKYIQLDTRQTRQNSKNDLLAHSSSANFDILPPLKSVRTRRSSDAVTVVPNASTFIPIPEDVNKIRTKSMNVFELYEQDDEYYDHTNDINNELKSKQITSNEKF